jgi:hypothetical protein
MSYVGKVGELVLPRTSCVLYIILRYVKNKLHVTCSLFSTDIIRKIKARKMRWEGHLARVERRGDESVQGVGLPIGLFIWAFPPRRRWENGIRMDLRETGWGYRMDPVGSE